MLSSALLLLRDKSNEVASRFLEVRDIDMEAKREDITDINNVNLLDHVYYRSPLADTQPISVAADTRPTYRSM